MPNILGQPHSSILLHSAIWVRRPGIELPMSMNYKYAGRGKLSTEFDLYVPALLVLSIIMILFTAGASIVREIEKDTITRLIFI